MSRRKMRTEESLVEGPKTETFASSKIMEREPVKVVEPVVKTAPKKRLDPNAVPLRVYITASGRRFDRTAGFQNYAIRSHMGPLTMVEWAAAEDRFRNLPVK